jgi:hypothetical protein
MNRLLLLRPSRCRSSRLSWLRFPQIPPPQPFSALLRVRILSSGPRCAWVRPSAASLPPRWPDRRRAFPCLPWAQTARFHRVVFGPIRRSSPLLSPSSFHFKTGPSRSLSGVASSRIPTSATPPVGTSNRSHEEFFARPLSGDPWNEPVARGVRRSPARAGCVAHPSSQSRGRGLADTPPGNRSVGSRRLRHPRAGRGVAAHGTPPRPSTLIPYDTHL